jgi:hypothetical protein
VFLSKATSHASELPPALFVKCQSVLKTVSPLTRTPIDPDLKIPDVAVSVAMTPGCQTQRTAPVRKSMALTDAPQAGMYTMSLSVSTREATRFPGLAVACDQPTVSLGDT